MFDIDTNVDNLSQEVNYTIKSIPSVNALSRIIKKGLRLEKKGYTVNYKYGNNREIGQQLKLAAEKVSNQFDYTTPKKVAWGVGGVLGFTTILNKINIMSNRLLSPESQYSLFSPRSRRIQQKVIR